MSFERAFEIVVGAEGGYVNDRSDPGGETKFGISKRAYPALDIRNLTIEQARTIYERDYWLAAGCDRLVDAVMATLIFDCAVNQGVGIARKIGVTAMTPVDFQADRALHYASLPTVPRFGKGWMRRLFNILLEAKV